MTPTPFALEPIVTDPLTLPALDCDGAPGPSAPPLERCPGCGDYSDEPPALCSASQGGEHHMVPVGDDRDCDDVHQWETPTPDTREMLAKVGEIEGRIEGARPNPSAPPNRHLYPDPFGDLAYLCATLRTLATGGRS